MNEKKKGFFIALEGIDGSGKSTQAKMLAEKLSAKGYTVYETREPTSGRIGTFIHDILLQKVDVSPYALSLLFVADRFEHAKDMRKALEAGKIVISDRYMLSTLAYQGAQGVDAAFLKRLHENLPKPDITFLLDISPEKVQELQRIQGKLKAFHLATQSKELFEKLELQRTIREKYLEFAKLDETIHKVDSSEPVQKVSDGILSASLRHIKPIKEQLKHTGGSSNGVILNHYLTLPETDSN